MRWILGLITGAIGLLRRWFDKRRDDAIREQGRLEQANADQKAALEAHQRMDEAGARPRDTQRDLDRGTF